MFLLAFLLLVVQPSVPHRTVEMTPVAAEGELAKELGRYGMTAWRTVNRGPKFSCLAYTPPNAGRKPIPLVVYIPGKGEIVRMGTDPHSREELGAFLRRLRWLSMTFFKS